MWCVPELTEEFIERMEDVLSTYGMAYNCKQPVICLDEKPVQFLEDSRTGIHTAPGIIKKRIMSINDAELEIFFVLLNQKQAGILHMLQNTKRGKTLQK